jgi:hypothetical protein
MVGHNAPSEKAIASCGTAILAVLAVTPHGRDARAASRGTAILAVLAVSPRGQDARATPGLKVQKSAGHNCCNVISPHPTLARTRVEVRFDFL